MQHCVKVEPVEIIFDDSLLFNILPEFRDMEQLHKKPSQLVCPAEDFQKTYISWRYHGTDEAGKFQLSLCKYCCTLNMSFDL